MGMIQKIQGREIYLDTNIFIYLLEGYNELIPLFTQLFELIDAGTLRGFTSELTLAETLVKPTIDGNLTLQQIYKNTLQTSTNLEVMPITRDVLIEAACVRANLRPPSLAIRLPDAIHIASAQKANCKTFLTNDKRLKADFGMEVILVSEITAAKLIIS